MSFAWLKAFLARFGTSLMSLKVGFAADVLGDLPEKLGEPVSRSCCAAASSAAAGASAATL